MAKLLLNIWQKIGTRQAAQICNNKIVLGALLIPHIPAATT
jgi:hypothetical protein